MRILYVTTAWTGLSDVLFNGSVEPRGMPAFIKPLQGLINKGYKIDYILIHNFQDYPRYDIKVDWIKKEDIVGGVYWEKNMIKKPMNAINLYNKTLRAMHAIKYDFVYAHGESAEPSRLVAKKMGVNFGHRLYGTFLYDYIYKNNKFKAKIIHFLEYSAFKSKKKFLLVTNDGSKGDKAYFAINKNKKPSDFNFLYNGIDHTEEIPTEVLEKHYKGMGSEPFLFYVARIDRWKRQDEAIKILKLINDKGYNLKLYIAGQVINKEYYLELQEMVQSLGLKENIIFMGIIDRQMINIMSKLAICSFSLYDMCNLGNVFHELLSSGAVIMSKNDGSLNDFIIHEKNGFLLNHVEEAPHYIELLISDINYVKHIRKNAMKASHTKMLSWEERIEQEIELIEKHLDDGKI